VSELTTFVVWAAACFFASVVAWLRYPRTHDLHLEFLRFLGPVCFLLFLVLSVSLATSPTTQDNNWGTAAVFGVLLCVWAGVLAVHETQCELCPSGTAHSFHFGDDLQNSRL
jgi:hypothetical protein